MARTSFFPNATLNVDISPEYMGVGYVIGPRIAGVMFAGGVLSWLVLLPLLSILGNYMTVPASAGARRAGCGSPDMNAQQLWSAYIRYTGAGAVLASGIITLVRTIPTIVSSFRDSMKDFGAGARGGGHPHRARPAARGRRRRLAAARHLPRAWCRACRRKATSSPSLLVIVFGFFFVTVSSRITGLIGSSSNPISGMTIATLILTCSIFVALGWTGDFYSPDRHLRRRHRLHRGGERGRHVAGSENRLHRRRHAAATSRSALIIGVLTSSLVIGMTTLYLHRVMGIGSPSLPAPQATLMATIIKGLLSQNLPWGLVLVGVFISVTLELCGIHSLSFAVGSYLPIATTAPIFAGGLVRAFVEKRRPAKPKSQRSAPARSSALD